MKAKSYSLDPVITVILLLGLNITMIILGAVLLATRKGQPFPEWTKDVVLIMVGGLVGILAQRSISHPPGGPPIQVEAVNTAANPVPVELEAP